MKDIIENLINAKDALERIAVTEDERLNPDETPYLWIYASIDYALEEVRRALDNAHYAQTKGFHGY